MRNIVCILSVSGYSDLWLSTRKSIIDNLYILGFDSVIFSTDKKVDVDVNQIVYGEGISWSEALRIALEHLREFDNVLFSFDDLVVKDVKSRSLTMDVLNSQSAAVIHLSGGYTSLIPQDNGLLVVGHNSRYFGSLVFSIWNKKAREILYDKLENVKWTPWEYERFIGNKIFTDISIYTPSRRVVTSFNLVIKGLINPLELIRVKRTGVAIVTGRKSMGLIKAFKFEAYRFTYNLIRYVIPRLFERIGRDE